MKNKNLYLLAFYSLMPKDPKRTKEPGYITQFENVEYDESINITRGLKIKDELSAGIILDLSNQTVKKNSFKEDTRDFPSLLAHFQEGYPKYLNPLIVQLYSGENDESNRDNQ